MSLEEASGEAQYRETAFDHTANIQRPLIVGGAINSVNAALFLQ